MRLHIGDSIGEPFQGLSGNGVKLSPDKRNLAFSILGDNSWFHCLNLVCHRPGPGYAIPALGSMMARNGLEIPFGVALQWLWLSVPWLLQVVRTPS